MENINSLFMWSDNWWKENDKVWFVGGLENILFCLNLKTNKCELAVCIPEETSSTFRLTPLCMKSGDEIFCMPDNGDILWIYNTYTKKFSKICIDNPNKVKVGTCEFCEHNNKLFIVSSGLGQIIEIDITKKKIDNYYVLGGENGIGRSIKYGTVLYSLSNMSDEIYQFDLITKEIMIHRFPDIGRKFFTLCFDGEQFWMSGCNKEIYVWNREENAIRIIDEFPKEFGIYNFTKDTNGEVDCTLNKYELPTFLYSVAVGENVWFIPFQTNKIVYVNKKNYKVYTLEIAEENETKESLLGRRELNSKYILEYVQGDRYIGLFSVKNNCILEIDVLDKKYEMKYYALSEKCIYGLIEIYNRRIFYENNKVHEYIFKYAVLNQDEKKNDRSIDNIGLEIYKTM